MLYQYGQIECAGWFKGKQNVLTGATYIKISRDWRRCDLPILLDNNKIYLYKWVWIYCLLTVLSGTFHLDFVQLAALVLEYICVRIINDN